jgi:hypothetical protein
MPTPSRRRARVSTSSTTSWLWLRGDAPAASDWFFRGDSARCALRIRMRQRTAAPRPPARPRAASHKRPAAAGCRRSKRDISPFPPAPISVTTDAWLSTLRLRRARPHGPSWRRLDDAANSSRMRRDRSRVSCIRHCRLQSEVGLGEGGATEWITRARCPRRVTGNGPEYGSDLILT